MTSFLIAFAATCVMLYAHHVWKHHRRHPAIKAMMVVELSGGPKSGYQLARAVEQRLGDGTMVPPGCCHTLLDELIEQGLVRERRTPDVQVPGGWRFEYALTPQMLGSDWGHWPYPVPPRPGDYAANWPASDR